MRQHYSESISKLISYFSDLPGIGPKTAEKFVFYLVKQNKEYLQGFSQTISDLIDRIKICSICHNYSEKSTCSICDNSKRNKTVICVVARPQDIAALEKTHEYQGVYHMLGGVLNPLEEVTPDKLNITQLLERIKKDKSKEIILALNPDIEGETTSLYLKKTLQPLNVKITRLARGLPMGSDLEYADEVTLTNALKGRREI
ncbi:recombination mediator RecR [Patescibacteria group bacterium]|nr:recombination mediator RecR [Patescibacteria group bacterium]